MATFKGSGTEFKRFIGPLLRNLVNQITKNHKRAVGSCEHCGTSGELHAAHVHGKDRLDIIESILRRSNPDNSAEFAIDLQAFEHSFKFEHSPIEKAILVLCDVCHRKYDSATFDPERATTSPPPTKKPLRPSMPADLLPITLDPPRMTDFVDQLLRTRTAEIQTYFRDGRVKSQTWHANQFTRDSNLFGNLRSRPEFRQGQWQDLGIAKVHVLVVVR